MGREKNAVCLFPPGISTCDLSLFAMNILPLVFAILTIFAFISLTFLKEVKGFYIAEIASKSLHTTERTVSNKIASKAYRNAEGETIQKKNSDPNHQQPKTFYCRRSFFPPFENSKFNIAPLIAYEGECKLHPLYEPLAEMLRRLYKEELFSADKMEYRLLDAILAKARKESAETIDLARLYPDDPALRKVYYNMLKGTNQYALKKSMPPLKDVVTVRKGAAAIYFSFASPILLMTLFGDTIAQHIMGEDLKKRTQTNKYYFFPKEELQAL